MRGWTANNKNTLVHPGFNVCTDVNLFLTSEQDCARWLEDAVSEGENEKKIILCVSENVLVCEARSHSRNEMFFSSWIISHQWSSVSFALCHIFDTNWSKFPFQRPKWVPCFDESYTPTFAKAKDNYIMNVAYFLRMLWWRSTNRFVLHLVLAALLLLWMQIDKLFFFFSSFFGFRIFCKRKCIWTLESRSRTKYLH